MGGLKACLTLLLLLSALTAATPGDLVYVGTYGHGIHAYRFHADSGEFDSLGLAADTPSPSFLALHPSRRFLYAVNETSDGSVTSFAIDDQTGKLKQLNQRSSRGGSPCHLAVDQTGKMLVAANYQTGSLIAFPILEDGSLGESSAFVQHQGSSIDPKRQDGPHAHSVTFSRDGKFVIAADLGVDKLFVYRTDLPRATLTANDPPFVQVTPGAGPRHFAFAPNGDRAYLINEMASTVTAFDYDAKRGSLRQFQTTSTLPDGYEGKNTTAEIAIDRTGRFLYGSNRGHDSIAVFAIDPTKGTLSPVEQIVTGGKMPRNFTIDPAGAYLLAANQMSDNVVVFRIGASTGRLTPAGKVLSVSSPVCVLFR